MKVPAAQRSTWLVQPRLPNRFMDLSDVQPMFMEFSQIQRGLQMIQYIVIKDVDMPFSIRFTVSTFSKLKAHF